MQNRSERLERLLRNLNESYLYHKKWVKNKKVFRWKDFFRLKNNSYNPNCLKPKQNLKLFCEILKSWIWQTQSYQFSKKQRSFVHYLLNWIDANQIINLKFTTDKFDNFRVKICATNLFKPSILLQSSSSNIVHNCRCYRNKQTGKLLAFTSRAIKKITD